MSLVCKHTRHGICLQVVLSESKRCNCSNLTLPLVKGYLAIKLQCLHNRIGKFSFVQFGNITCTQNGASNGPNSRESMRRPAETTKPISSKLLAHIQEHVAQWSYAFGLKSKVTTSKPAVSKIKPTFGDNIQRTILPFRVNQRLNLFLHDIQLQTI